MERALRWTDSEGEWIASAGWVVISELAVAKALDARLAMELLDRIEADIAGAKNRVRHNMNNALIAIGGTIEEARPRALEVARAIGQVEVDHGRTGCKTPDAAPYIQRMVDHAKKKGARAKKKAKRRS